MFPEFPENFWKNQVFMFISISTMGQRIVISESERKHIMNLYEADKPSNLPPPDERELVVKDKNPFKYPEYEDARRGYSADLKDGDRFYTTKRLGLEYTDFIMREKPVIHGVFTYDYIFTPIFKNLIGKSVRHSYKDEIIELKYIGVSKFNFGDDKEFKLSFGLDRDYDLIIDENGKSYKRRDFGGEIELSDKEKNSYGSLIDYCYKLLKEFTLKYYNLISGKNWDEIPDEYFDIYKVKRRQTDF